MKREAVFVVGCARTPVGKYGGCLSSLTAVDLGAAAISGALTRSGVSPQTVDEVYFGCVLQAGLGQAPARQCSLLAAIPSSVPCTTINKVCASGLKSAMIGASSIAAGANHIVVCGGSESMSNAPYYARAADIRVHSRPTAMGNKTLVDGMLHDGLWDVYGDQHMGRLGELCAKKYSISRQRQDDFAVDSFKKAQLATESGLFKKEITAVTVKTRKGEICVDKDEGISFNEDKLRNLRPAFVRSKDGTVTAANASQLSDGAAAVILASGTAVRKYGLKPLAKILSFADAAKDPTEFTTAPTPAIRKALELCGLKSTDLTDSDYIEINEAFSVVALANTELLALNPSRVNVFGGAVALGHPLACSGARLLVTICNQLQHFGGRYGVIGICNGGGGASAMVLQRTDARSKL